MERFVSLFIALAFSAASAAAVAERPAGGYEQESEATGTGSAPRAVPSFEQADKDGSGSVEVSEMTGIAGLDISAADRDNDGKLSRSEYEAAKKSHEEGMRDGTTSAPGGATR